MEVDTVKDKSGCVLPDAQKPSTDMAAPGTVNTELLAGTRPHGTANSEPITFMDAGEDEVGPNMEVQSHVDLHQQPATLRDTLILTGRGSELTVRQRDVAFIDVNNTQQVTAVTETVLDVNPTNSGFAVALTDVLVHSNSEQGGVERRVALDYLNHTEKETAATEKSLAEDRTSGGLADITTGDVFIDLKSKTGAKDATLGCMSNAVQMTTATEEGALPVEQTSKGFAVTASDSLTENQTTEAMDKPFKEDAVGGEVATTIREPASSKSDREVEAGLAEQDHCCDNTTTFSEAPGNSDTPTAGKERIDIQLHCPECTAINNFYVCEGMLAENTEAGEKVRLHAGAVPIQCKQCGASFQTCIGIVKPAKDNAALRQNCSKRGRSSEGVEKPYKCLHCDKAFNYRYSCKVHMQAHTGEKPLKCSECGATFRRPHRLYEHLKASHSDSVILVKCPHCPKHFTSSESLNEHTPLHTMERPYSCVYCPSAFKTRFDRDRHALVHTGERPYKCNQCSAAFKRPFSLTQHIRSKHTEAGKKPPRQPSLKPRKKYTRRNDTRERPFKCAECECAYMTAQKLKDHTVLKHKAVVTRKTYSCHMCDSVFRKISDLNVHIKSHW